MAGGFLKLVVEVVEGLADEAGVGAGGEEVGVAVPAGDEVEVEVSGQAGAGAAVDVEAEVEALGLDGFGEGFLGVGGEAHDFEQGGVREVGEVGEVVGGCDEQVAGGVGEAVEDDEAAGGAPEDEVFTVAVWCGPIIAEEAALVVGGGGEGLEVFDAPGGPEVVVFHSWDLLSWDDLPSGHQGVPSIVQQHFRSGVGWRLAGQGYHLAGGGRSWS